jgi:hypothetical protein
MDSRWWYTHTRNKREFTMIQYLHARLPSINESQLDEFTLELRAYKLNQRMIDAYYAQQKALNAKEYDRLAGAN